MISLPSQRNQAQWTGVRVAMTIFVSLSHVALATLSFVAVFLKTGGPIQVSAMALDLTTLLFTASFYLHNQLSRGEVFLDKTQEICLFTVLTALSFVVCVILLARLPQTKTGSLSSDFASLGGGPTSKSVVIVACFSVLVALVGLASIFGASSSANDERKHERKPIQQPRRQRKPIPHFQTRINVANCQPVVYLPFFEEAPRSISQQPSFDPAFDWGTYDKGLYPDGRAVTHQERWTTVKLR